MHNEVHHGKGVGVLVCDNAKGVIEDNTIACNGRAGIAILSGGDPLVRACTRRPPPCKSPRAKPLLPSRASHSPGHRFRPMQCLHQPRRV